MKRFRILLEGSRDKALETYLPLFQKRGIEVTLSQLKQFLLNKFVTEAGIHNLSLRSNYYLAGVARYYFNGDLTTNKRLNALYANVKDKFNMDVCSKLDALIEVLRYAYIDSVGTQFEQPEDFGTLSLKQLLRKYNKKINQALGIEVEKKADGPSVSDDYTAGNGYTYEIIYSQDEVQKYKVPTSPGSWCISYSENHYNTYIKRLGIHYVIFKKDGYENVPRRTGKNFTKQKPHDEYGNSLIALLQSNSSPEPVYITSRWNHGSTIDGTQGTEADHAYTKNEFLNVIGSDGSILKRIYEQWKANKPNNSDNNRKEANKNKLDAIRKFKYAQMLINSGARINDVFSELKIIIRTSIDTNFSKDNKLIGTYLVAIEVGDGNDTYYATLMDRKKLYFDDMLIECSYWSRIVEAIGLKWIKFLNKRKENLMYDRIGRRFVDIDGIIKFKHSSYIYNNDDSPFMFVAMSSNQVGAIDLNSMKPVKSPNGNGWFESITKVNDSYNSNRTFSGKIRFPYITSSDLLLDMVYDSSAMERYVYNIRDRKFVTTKLDGGFEYRGRYLGDGVISLINPSGFVKCIDSKNGGEVLNINGFDTFTFISNDDDIIYFKPVGEDYTYYYDTKIREMIRYDNGEVLKLKGNFVISKFNNRSGYVIIYSEDRNDINCFTSLIYNPLTHKLVRDGISGSYVFNVKKFSSYNDKTYSFEVIVINPNNGEPYALKSPKEDYNESLSRAEVRESVLRDFRNFLGRLDKYYKSVL